MISMNYFKIVENGYISFIGICGNTDNSITKDEYEKILSIIHNKPKDTSTHYHMLDAETLEYVVLERPVPIEVDAEPTM